MSPDIIEKICLPSSPQFPITAQDYAIAWNVGHVKAPYAALTLPEVRYKSHKGGTCNPKAGCLKAVPFALAVLQDIIATIAKSYEMIQGPEIEWK